MLPALPDLWGFTAVLSSCFKKTGKRKQKVRYPFLLVPVLPVLLPTSGQPGWELPSQPGQRAVVGQGFHSCFREGAAVPCRGGAGFPCKSLFF